VLQVILPEQYVAGHRLELDARHLRAVLPSVDSPWTRRRTRDVPGHHGAGALSLERAVIHLPVPAAQLLLASVRC
jgi:hypothetical protein